MAYAADHKSHFFIRRGQVKRQSRSITGSGQNLQRDSADSERHFGEHVPENDFDRLPFVGKRIPGFTGNKITVTGFGVGFPIRIIRFIRYINTLSKKSVKPGYVFALECQHTHQIAARQADIPGRDSRLFPGLIKGFQMAVKRRGHKRFAG